MNKEFSNVHSTEVEEEVKMVLDFYIKKYKSLGIDMQFMLDTTPRDESKQYIREHWDLVA